MTKASRAALLSGLIFPGIGHIQLQQYLRGSALMLAALVATSIIVKSIFRRAQTIVDQIIIGDIPVETVDIAELVANSASTANGLAENTALLVLMICWLIGIIDSYRLGAAEDRRDI